MQLNRSIKFRAWDWDRKTMVYDFNDSNNGYELAQTNADEIVCGNYMANGDYQNVDLMQYTGLKDKNGTEIYEGDIVKAHDHPDGIWDVTDAVTYSQGEWCLNSSIIRLPDYGAAWIQVIGNIYQNPEHLQK